MLSKIENLYSHLSIIKTISYNRHSYYKKRAKYYKTKLNQNGHIYLHSKNVLHMYHIYMCDTRDLTYVKCDLSTTYVCWMFSMTYHQNRYSCVHWRLPRTIFSPAGRNHSSSQTRLCHRLSVISHNAWLSQNHKSTLWYLLKIENLKKNLNHII